MKRVCFAKGATLLCLCLISYFANPAITHGGESDIKIKVAHQFPTKHIQAKAVQKFIDLVTERTKGKAKFQLFPAAQLYKAKQMIEAVTSGEIDMGLTYMGFWSGIFKEAMIMDIPYLIDTYDVADKMLAGEVGDFFAGKMEKAGAVKVMWLGQGIYLGFTNNDKFLRKPEDFKGLTFRAASKGTFALAEALGAKGVQIAASELYMALQRGTVDIGYTSITSIVKRSLFEVQKYCTIAPVKFPFFAFLANKDFWGKLPEDVRAEMQKTGAEVEDWMKAELRQEENESIKYLKQKMQTHVLTKDEVEMMVKATKNVRDKILNQIGKDGEYLVQQIDKLK